jgi:predicted amidohydrolase
VTDRLTLAIAQSEIGADPARNAAAIRADIARAASAGARLVLFPETALSGYVKTDIHDWTEVDWPAVDHALEQIAATAAEVGIWVAVGCNTALAPPAKPLNSLVVISDTGEIVTRYDKRFLSFNERRDWYTPGTGPRVFEVDGLRFGCAICIEVQFPELFAEYERLDIDCVLFPAYSDDPMFWTLARAHAATNCLWLAFSNPAKHAGRVPSGWIGPDGAALARAGAESRDLLIVRIDRHDPAFQTALTKARPWRKVARRLAARPGSAGTT